MTTCDHDFIQHRDDERCPSCMAAEFRARRAMREPTGSIKAPPMAFFVVVLGAGFSLMLLVSLMLIKIAMVLL